MVLVGFDEVERFIEENGIEHFTPDEFKCPCCGKVRIDSDLLLLLERVRVNLSRPIVITSGYRCPTYNAKIGGVPNSAHVYGYAVDIRVKSSQERYSFVSQFLKEGIRRMGIGANFIHIDIDPNKPQDVIWTYYGKGG